MLQSNKWHPIRYLFNFNIHFVYVSMGCWACMRIELDIECKFVSFRFNPNQIHPNNQQGNKQPAIIDANNKLHIYYNLHKVGHWCWPQATQLRIFFLIQRDSLFGLHTHLLTLSEVTKTEREISSYEINIYVIDQSAADILYSYRAEWVRINLLPKSVPLK